MADREANLIFRAETAEFREAVTKANSTLKTMRSAVRMVDAQMTAAGTSTDALRQKDQLLRQEQAQLEAKVTALTAEHRKAIEVYGANSTQAQRYATQLNNTRRDLALCEAKVRSNNAALQDAERAEREADTALGRLNATIADQEHQMSLLGDAYREAIVEHGRESQEVKDLEAEMRALNSELQDNRRVVKAADDAAEQFNRELNSSDSSARRASEGFTVFKGAVSHLASSVFQNAVDKARELGREVVNLGIDFESSMARVQALSGATSDEYTALESMARQLGSSTRFTASQVADGFGYMALAGWDCQSMLSGIPGVLNLAAAAEMDLGQASDIVTDYLTAFGLSAKDSERFVDQMTFAMANSNTDVEQLGEAYKNCAATASSMNYSVEDTTAALMVMANAGVKGGEAGTALNAVMTRLATDTKGCATELEKYGVHVYDSEGRMQSLSSILQGMGGVWEKLNDEQQAGLAKTIAGVNHYSNLQTIMTGVSEAAKEGGQGFVDYTEALQNCSGSAQQMSDIMMDTAQGDLYTMQSALEETGLKLYEKFEQPLRSAMQFVTGPGTSALNWLVEHLNMLPPVFLAIVAALVQLKTKTSVFDLMRSGATKMRAAFDTSSVSVNRLSRETVAGEIVWKKYNATTGQTTVVTGKSTAALRLQQGALKVHALAVKGASTALRGLKTAMAAIAPMAAISLATEAIMRFSQASEEAAEKQAAVKKATDGLNGSFGQYEAAYRSVTAAAEDATAGAEDYAASLKTTAEMAAEAREHQGQLAESLSETWADVGTKNAMVDQYVATIERLAGNTGDNVEKQGELQAAVAGLNEIMGTSYAVVDQQNGILNVSTDTIKANAAAWQEKALAEAATAAQSDLMKQHIENQTALAKATEEWEEAQRNLNAAAGDFESAMYAQRVRDTRAAVDELEAQDRSCVEEMERMNSVIGSLGEAYSAAPESIQAYIDSTASVKDALEGAAVNADDFSAALASIGVSTEDLAAMTPELLQSLVDQYQTDIGGLAQWCAENGIQIPGNLAAGMEQGNADVQQAAQQNVQQYRDTVQLAATSAPQDGANVSAAAAGGAASNGGAWQQAAAGNVGQYTATVNMATGEVAAAGTAYATASGDAAVQASERGGAEAGAAQIDSYTSSVDEGRPKAENSARQVSQGAANAMRDRNSFYASGAYDAQGFIDGMDSKIPAAAAKAREMARATIEAIKAEGGEGSPWRETMPSGRFAVQGFMAGEEQEIPELVKTNQRIARETVNAMTPEGLGFAWQLDAAMSGVSHGGLSVVESALPVHALQGYIDTAMEAHDHSSEIVDAIEKLAGRVTVLEINGVRFASAIQSDSDAVNGRRQELVDRGLAL